MQISRIGPFALEGPLGAADGNVLRGVHVERQAAMAVKLLPKSVLERAMGRSTLVDDVKVFSGLQHPHIAHVYGAAVEHGQPYMAVELVDGESLRERLDRRGKLTWEATVELADQVCDALRLAHSKGVVHQRLTPSRVLLVRPDDQVKLVGFDCVLGDHDEVLGLRSPMSVAHYLAPEEFRGKQSASHPQCDLFSLGVILYECLSGQLPWQADTPAELVMARRAGPAPRVSSTVLDCPVWLDVLVKRLLETKRGDRFASADETHRAIVDARRKVASGMGAAQQAWSGRKGRLTVDADRSEVRELRRRQHSSRRERDDSPFYERAWFLALCLVAVIGVGVWSLWPPSEEALFAKAQPLMESDDPTDWRRAEDQYVQSLRERFPDGKYAEQVRQFDERYNMHKAEIRANNDERLGRPSKSEAERLFIEARRFERFGDRLSAWQKYESLVELLNRKASDDPYDRAYVGLAQRQIGRIKAASDSQGDLGTFVEERLAEAESLSDEGQPLDARRMLRSIVTLYDGNRELKSQVARAREMIDQIDSSGRVTE